MTSLVPAGDVDFAKDVYPVLRRNCFECHGASKHEGNLRLDSSEGAAHESVKSGDLVRRITLPTDHEEAMPKRGARLSSHDVQLLRAWIDAGAPFPADLKPPVHWAYAMPTSPAIPVVHDTSWPKNDIDRFIRARLEQEKLSSSPEAEPAVLLRRLSFDTRGLPPTPAEVLQFEEECRTGEREAVWGRWVDRFLASEDFGVKWARHWLDLARYADSHGYQRDDLRSIWAYRDWVVSALNADMPFDQFTVEQVAGDLLPGAKPSQIIATGFHRCTPTNVEAGTEPEESRINQVIDRVNTTGAVWLGTTLECAQCHNHKYDPFTQKDYYSLLAYFNNTEKEAERTNPKVPGSIQFKGVPMKLRVEGQDTQRSTLAGQIAQLDKLIAAKNPQNPVKLSASAKGAVALVPETFETESGAEHELLPDNSVLLSGEAPDVETFLFKADLPQTELKAVLVEALTHESLPGNGPGRGNAVRPNFVLSDASFSLECEGPASPLKFAAAQASFSQAKFDAVNLIDSDPKTGWGINPRFGESHWTALILDQPMKIKPGSKLVAKLAQNFGGKRTIGRVRISAISGEIAAALPQKNVLADTESAAAEDPMLGRLKKQRAALSKKLAAIEVPTTEVMKELPEARMTTLFKRGDWTQPGDKAEAGTPAVFDLKGKGAPNRLTLARWLISKENPLTARVTVNRWWAEIFGQGIVSTVEDFGIKGEPPSHPELLDYLATQFMQRGWSMKQILRLIFTSATYRQSSRIEDYAVDPANVLLARGPRMRLDAEAIRDNALAIAGLLNHSLGGPPIRPPQPDGLWAKVGGQQYKYEVSTGAEQYRRGLYVVLKRGSPYPSMVNFDASARMACVVKRSRSNTPLQALTLLNDPVYVDAARALAARVLKEAASEALDVRLTHAFRLAVARSPSPGELGIVSDLFAAQKATSGEKEAWEAVASALLNLDETITKP